VEKAIEFLSTTALEEEGLLRLSGSVAEINRLREEIESGKPITKIFNGSTRWDPNAVAGLLKSFLRELPEPIISKEVNEGATVLLSYGGGEEVMSEIRSIIHSLPTPNFELFKLIVWFLLQVAANSEKTKMNANNLLRVITPTLRCIPGFISLPMDYYDYFFGENEELYESNEEIPTDQTNGEKKEVL